MADGLAGSTLANLWLSWLSGTAESAPAGNYVGLFLADPGSGGVSNPSSVTTRQAMTFSAPSGGVLTMSNTPSWTSWAGTNGEVVTDIAVFSAATGGSFLFSCQLASAITVNTGDTLTLSSLTITLSPIAT